MATSRAKASFSHLLTGPRSRLTWLGFWQLVSIFQILKQLINLAPLDFDALSRIGGCCPTHVSLGLPRRVYRERPVLCCFSSAVVPRPRDWPSHVHLTGYWFLDEPEYRPSEELAAFLEAGPPPVYVGFGSMAVGDPSQTFAAIRAAVHEAGCRAVISTGWAGVSVSAAVSLPRSGQCLSTRSMAR